MTELMNAVFSDSAIWKKIGSTYVLQLSPPGIVPSPERLRRIRAYGHACLMYVILEKSLPIQISTLFAYACLTPGGADVALGNRRLLRILAPLEADAIDDWPETLEEFQNRFQDVETRSTLQTLTLQYFTQTVCSSRGCFCLLIRCLAQRNHRRCRSRRPTVCTVHH